MTRTAWIAELDRRIAAANTLEKTFAWEALKDFRRWIIDQPEPDASELVKEARSHDYSMATFAESNDLLQGLADALEAAEAKLARATGALRHYAGTEVEIHHKRQGGLVEVPHQIDLGHRARETLKEIE